MNKDQVKKLYDATSQEYGLPEFNLFFNYLQDDKKRKEFFDLANVKYDIGNSIEEFDSNLGIKKKIQSEELVQIGEEKPRPKSVGIPSIPQPSLISSTPTVPSTLPLGSEPLKSLKGADQTKIAARAKEIGLDALALSAAVNDFEADDEFIINKSKEYSTNKAEYDKSKAAYTWRTTLRNSMKSNGLSDEEINTKFDYATQLQKLDLNPVTGEKVPVTYSDSLNRVSSIRDIINENIFDEASKAEALRGLTIDGYAALWRGLKEQNVVNEWAKSGNVFIGAGLDMLRLTDPKRAANLQERIQNQYASKEDKALYLRELENIGLNAISFEVDRNFNRVSQSQEKPSQSYIDALANWKSLAEQTKRSQINRYGDVTNADVDRMLLDVTEGLETSTGKKAVYNIAAGASEWLERGLSGIWDYATKNEQERIAADMKRDHSKYLTEELLNYADVGSSLREAEYIPKLVDPEIKKQVDDIIANTSLSRNEKYEATYPLIKKAYTSGGIEFFSNPNKGNINLTSKNVLHLLSTSGARSAGNIIPVLASGGALPTSLVAGLDAAAMKYDEQFRAGENDPLARSLRSGLTVGALAGVMDEAAALSKALKGGSASLVAKPTAIGAAKGFGTMVGKEQVEELATEALDGDVVMNWKEVMLSTAIIAPLFAGPTAIIDNRRSSEMYRQMWYEAGATPELTKNGLKKMVNDGSINESQYNDAIKRVDRMSQIVANMPKTDLKGNPLSDSQKAKYADNLMKKYDAQAIPEMLPTKIAEDITNQAKKADEENATILQGEEPSTIEPTDTKQIEAKEQIKQKNDFITDADFVEEAFTPEEDAQFREELPESQFKTEEELADFLANGQYAMLTGQNPEATPLSKQANAKLNEKAQQWLASRGLTAIPIFGKYGNSERSFMVPNMTKRQAVEFAKEFQQESVAHSTGLVFQDGSFNPRKEGVDLSPRFDQGGDFFSSIKVGGKNVDFSINYNFDKKVEPKKALYESLRQRVFGDTNRKVASAQKALEATGVKINMVEDPAEFDNKVAQLGGQKGLEGVFVSDTGDIFINQSKLDQGIADGRVIWHEASHPVVNIVRNTNPKLFNQVVSGLKEAAANNKGVADALAWAESNYAEDGQGTVDDEAVVETIAGIAEGVIDINNLSTGLKQSIIEFINSIAKVLGLGQILNDTDVAAFKKLAGQVADALTTGKDISEIVGQENVKNYISNLESPELAAGGTMNAPQPRVTTAPAVNVYASKDVVQLEQRSLNDVYEKFGGKAVVINSDPTRVGTLTLPSGKTIFMYGGPAYLSIKDNVDGNVGFATTQLSKVNTWSNYVNELFGDQPGVTLVGTQAPTSMLSNSYALRYVMDAISMLPKSVLRSSDFKNEFFGKNLVALKAAFGDQGYNDFVNKYKKADLSNPETIDGMIAEMAYTVGDNNSPASFKARGAFVSNLLGGIDKKAKLKGVEGDQGYVSKKPNKYIAKQLMDRLGINAEKVMREIGEPSLVDLYMNEGKWGMAVAGFETDPNVKVQDVQSGGVAHPLFNAKFPGKNAFILDGAYDLNEMFTPVEMTGPKGGAYTKTAAQMLAGSMYVKGQPLSGEGTFEYKNVSPSGRRIQASKGGRNLVANAGLNKEMTSDDQGNYVFYHYSGSKLKSIDPKKFGKNLATGRDERPGVGISMYYTRPDIAETGVPNDFGYIVRIPENKVYPFNADPLNLLPEAEKQFKKQYPDQAFDFNKQVGFVTKVAADRGYPMTVAEWNIKGRKALRAQTTEAMKPELFKERKFEDGYMVDKINDDLNFKPNAKRKQFSKGNRQVVGQINWERSPEGKGDPSISARNKVVTQAAADLKDGKITNEEYRATVSENSPILPITRFFEPATEAEVERSLDKNQAMKANSPVADGTKVGLRLDIPAYKNNNTWVVSVHEGDNKAGKAITYRNVARIKGVRFGVEPKASLNIAAGLGKAPINRIYGEWVNIPGDSMTEQAENAKAIVQEIVDDPSYVQVGMNPFRHSYFYDRNTDIGRPIVSADEVIQVGGLVYAKNPVYGEWTDEAYRVKGMLDKAGAPVQFSKGNRISTDTEIIDGFYSPIENRINDFKQPKASVQKWKEMVGMKSDEAVFSGLADWLGGMKPDRQLSKQEVLQFMKDNRIEINEVTKGAGKEMSQSDMDDVYNGVNERISRTNQPDEVVEFIQGHLDKWYNNPTDRNLKNLEASLGEANINLQDIIGDVESRMDDTKYSQYQLPGGENYKEVLITLPKKTGITFNVEKRGSGYIVVDNFGNDISSYKNTEKEAQDTADRLKNENKDLNIGETLFKSTHFDEPNIITHLRMNTRVDADGKKVLFLEEVQSDWGQKGKREGFAKPFVDKTLEDWLNGERSEDSVLDGLIDKYNIDTSGEYGIESELEQILKNQKTGVSAAPYVTNTNAWVKLGLKYALKEAIKQGADRIAWTTGEQQNERYDLSKQVDQILAVKEGDNIYRISGKKNNQFVLDKLLKENELETNLGKELAAKIINGEGFIQDPYGNITSVQVFEGDGLKVGGKGMNAFYGDAKNPGIVANVAKALVKELTGREAGVEKSDVGNGEQPAIEITPELRQQVSAGMPQFSKGNRNQAIKQFIRENAGQYSPDEISQAIQDELGISKQEADQMVADAMPKAQAPLAEEIQTFQEGTGEEQPRAMADQFDYLNPETEQQIDEEARTYFAKTNKQTDAEVDKFMQGKNMSDLADYVVSNPNIPARVKIWMAAKVAKNLGTEIEAARANGDKAAVQLLSQKRASIYNEFAKEATELGQAVQAFVAFQNDPSATNFFMNKILKQLKEKGVESITDQQKEDITNLLTDLSNAKPGLPKNKAIIALSHYLGRLAPVKMGDVIQAIWYAHILSGVTTQLKNIFANTTMIAFELPIGATWQSMKNMSLMPYVYAAKGFAGGMLKGLVKGADILRGGVTEKDANKFMGNEPILEYFSWKQTKVGKLGGGAVGKFLDFPLFIGISPTALKMVGRALAGADAFFSTASQEAMANMMAYNQAIAEGKSGITPNGYRRVQELLGNTKQVVENAEQTAIAEGFKPGTFEFKRRVIELASETRDEQNRVSAEEFGKRVTLTNEPEGFTRGVYEVATSMQRKLPLSRVIIPFTRIVSNISEMIINYSPAGAYRALTGIRNPKLSFKFSPQGENKLSDDERAELFLKSSMAIAGVTLLMSNIGDDEDDWFEITSGGPRDFKKKYELMKGGWRPYSIKTKDGKYISYAEWPIAGALSGLGAMRDMQYEKPDAKDQESRLGLAAYGYLTAFYDKSLLKGMSDFVDIFRPTGKYGPDAKTVERIQKFAANQVKAIGMTNLTQQVFKMIQEYNDDPIKEAKGWETLYRDLPVINDGLNPIIDVFGDPVTPSTSERLLPWMTVSDDKKDEMISFLNKKGIFIGIPEQKPFIELKTRTEREMTRDELYKYRKMAGEYTKAILMNRFNDMQKVSDRYEGEDKQMAWEKMVERVKSAARKRAYVDLLLNRKTDINKMFEDVRED